MEEDFIIRVHPVNEFTAHNQTHTFPLGGTPSNVPQAILSTQNLLIFMNKIDFTVMRPECYDCIVT